MVSSEVAAVPAERAGEVAERAAVAAEADPGDIAARVVSSEVAAERAAEAAEADPGEPGTVAEADEPAAVAAELPGTGGTVEGGSWQWRAGASGSSSGGDGSHVMTRAEVGVDGKTCANGNWRSSKKT